MKSWQKKGLIIFLSAILLIVPLLSAEAQNNPSACTQAGGTWITSQGGQNTSRSAGCLLPNNQFIPQGGTTPTTPPVSATAQSGTPASEDNSCAGPTPNILCRVVTSLLHIPLIFSSWILGISGVLLNAVLKYTIIELSQNIRGISGINVAWSVVRDIANMAFIFILIYIAIKTILGLGSGELKKVLVRVVIAALLINFSLFFTKLIIDASNLIALTFYERLAPGAGSGSILSSGLSNSFMQPLGLNSFFDVGGSTGALEKYGLDIPKTFVISVGGSIFLIITAFVFLASSLMFLIRYVNIIFLLILSPIAFLGAVLPGFGEKIRGWWSSALSAQAVFAPVFMILTWLVLTIIRDPNFFGTNASATPSGSSNNAAQALGTAFGSIAEAQNSVGVFGLIMNFIIIIVFTIGILIISKKVADQGGSIGAKVVGGALGATAWTSRQTIGRTARNISEMDDLKKAAASETPGLKRFLARTTLKSSQATAKGSLDLRGGLAAAGGGLGFDKKDVDLGLGSAGGKGGYEAIHKEKVKKMEEFGKSLEPSEMAKAQAREELDLIKNINPEDPEFKKEFAKERNSRTAELENEERRYNQIRREHLTKGSSLNAKDRLDLEKEMERREKRVKEAQNRVAEVGTISKYHEFRKKEAQSKVDDLFGVDEKEARKREAERIQKEEGVANLEEAKAVLKNREKTGAWKPKTIESAEDRRKKSYADSLTSRGGVGANEIPFFRIPGRKTKLWRANVDAAAKLKKGKKPLNERVKELLEETGELPKKDEAGEEGEGEGQEKTT